MPKRRYRRAEILIVVAIAALVLLLVISDPLVVQVPAMIVVGWISYLWQTIAHPRLDAAEILFVLVGIVGVVAATHFLFRWLFGGSGPESRRWSWKRTVRIDAVVAMVIVGGIAVAGIVNHAGWVIRSPESLRHWSGGARGRSANSLKQIAIATYSHDEAFHTLPCSTFDSTGQPMHSWQTALLPFLEEDRLYRQIDLTKPWNHEANAFPMSARLSVFRNYSLVDDAVHVYGVSHYAGNVHVVMGDRPKTFADFPAGTANTILAGEVAGNFRAWGDPLNARDPRLGSTGNPHGFSGPNGRPAQFAMLDGSVRTIDPKELAELLNKPSD